MQRYSRVIRICLFNPIMKKLTHINDLFYKRLQGFLDANLANSDLHAELVAKKLEISKSTLNRKLKELGKPSINDLIKECRLQHSIKVLSAGYTVGETSKRVGFKNPSYFTQCFKMHYNTTPAWFAKQQG